jgi:hypothetical protein
MGYTGVLCLNTELLGGGMMSDPDRELLEKILEQERKKNFANLTPDKHIEIFSAEQILVKEREFSIDTPRAGFTLGAFGGWQAHSRQARFGRRMLRVFEACGF